VVMISACQE